MSSWALLLALSGFQYDMVQGTMSFQPAICQSNFSTFWSTGKAWGIYRQWRGKSGKKEWEIEVLGGSREGISVNSSEETERE